MDIIWGGGAPFRQRLRIEPLGAPHLPERRPRALGRPVGAEKSQGTKPLDGADLPLSASPSPGMLPPLLPSHTAVGRLFRVATQTGPKNVKAHIIPARVRVWTAEKYLVLKHDFVLRDSYLTVVRHYDVTMFYRKFTTRAVCFPRPK